jgi:hypothetical protein
MTRTGKSSRTDPAKTGKAPVKQDVIVVTFMVYLDNIQAKTGKSPDDFLALAKKKGLIEHDKIVAKHAELLSWLKSDIGLGHGHANAVILYLRIRTKDPKVQETKKRLD